MCAQDTTMHQQLCTEITRYNSCPVYPTPAIHGAMADTAEIPESEAEAYTSDDADSLSAVLTDTTGTHPSSLKDGQSVNFWELILSSMFFSERGLV